MGSWMTEDRKRRERVEEEEKWMKEDGRRWERRR